MNLDGDVVVKTKHLTEVFFDLKSPQKVWN